MSPFKRALVCLICLIASAGTARAAVPPPAPAATATFDVGSLHVQQYGSGNRSVIFIPGLTCGPEEWSGEIARLAPHYTVYALTLPGFDGRPAIAPPLFQTTTSDFWDLLAQRHIDRPVVIGHSLGGTMGFMLATQHPERLSGVIALDGLPIYPTNVFTTPEKVKAAADGAAASMAAETQAQFAASERTGTLPYLVTAPGDVAAIAAYAGTADPKATGEWFREDLELDLRPALVKATLPIVLLAPYDATIDGKYAPTPAAKDGFYAGLIQNAPQATVVSIPGARHFAMYDQPEETAAAIDAALAKMATK